MASLSPLTRTDLPRSPSPSARPLTMSPLVSMMDIDETEGKGWEISFDTDTEDEDEEEAGLDFGMDVPCRDSKDSHNPDGVVYK